MTTGGPDGYDQRATTGDLGGFGRYLMSHSVDEAIRATRRVLDGTAAAEVDRQLHERLGSLNDDQRAAIEEVARNAVVEALHGLLHGASCDELRILYRGVDVAAESDGLHADLFIWIRELSQFPHDWEADGPLLD